MKIKFLGGVQTVTGSCHLLTIGSKNILLDCGQFQGGKATEKLNFLPFDFDAAAIDYVILSHAHIDHSGRIPLLVKRGFQGTIYCTDATLDLADIMLKDSGYIHQRECEWENRKAIRAGKPTVEPLYTFEDAVNSLQYFSAALYDQWVELDKNIKLRFHEAGHILGSAIVEILATENGKTSKIIFSGDLGMKDRPILRDPAYIEDADYLIMETTYGGRIHPKNSETIEALIDIILNTAKKGGNIVIPAFAVGRTQEIIYELNRYYENSPEHAEVLENINVYVDSPLATSATTVFRNNASVFDEETKAYILKGDHPLDFKNLIFTRSAEESQAINFIKEPKVIISASGMCDAGRIKHHLKHNLWGQNNSIVFVGYQAEGTLGRRIKDGEKKVTIFGEEIYINAEIHALEGMSGHADQPSLLDWVSGFTKKPKQIFLVHGEEESKVAFADLLKSELGYDAIQVNDTAEFELEESVHLDNVSRIGYASFEDLISIKENLSTLHEDLEKILYNAHLAVSDNISDEKAQDIQNTLLHLQKQVINLGANVAE